ncbi:MAG: hypothetical protein ACXAC7_22650, partial [Candidatus Hodarchaeales archaeon]
ETIKQKEPDVEKPLIETETKVKPIKKTKKKPQKDETIKQKEPDVEKPLIETETKVKPIKKTKKKAKKVARKKQKEKVKPQMSELDDLKEIVEKEEPMLDKSIKKELEQKPDIEEETDVEKLKEPTMDELLSATLLSDFKITEDQASTNQKESDLGEIPVSLPENASLDDIVKALSQDENINTGVSSIDNNESLLDQLDGISSPTPTPIPKAKKKTEGTKGKGFQQGFRPPSDYEDEEDLEEEIHEKQLSLKEELELEEEKPTILEQLVGKVADEIDEEEDKKDAKKDNSLEN